MLTNHLYAWTLPVGVTLQTLHVVVSIRTLFWSVSYSVSDSGQPAPPDGYVLNSRHGCDDVRLQAREIEKKKGTDTVQPALFIS